MPRFELFDLHIGGIARIFRGGGGVADRPPNVNGAHSTGASDRETPMETKFKIVN